MVDAVQRRAGTECIHVDIAKGAQFPVGGDHRPFTPAPNQALISSHTTSKCESLASDGKHNRAGAPHQASHARRPITAFNLAFRRAHD
jgi:hypothetical protein